MIYSKKWMPCPALPFNDLKLLMVEVKEKLEESLVDTKNLYQGKKKKKI